MPRLFIRKAYLSDLESVLELYMRAFDETERLSPVQARQMFRRMASYPDYALYLATLEGRVVGAFELLIMDNFSKAGIPSAVVEDVAVDPKCQGSGVGKKMMRFAMGKCRKAGCYKLALSSSRKRVPAHRFYESLGFRKHGYSFLVELEPR